MPTGDSMLELITVMDRLRSPGGCPWDARQTHKSLVEYLIEETYEVVEAIEAGSPVDLCEELGDLLLQVVFHARIASENDGFNIDGVAQGIVAKLIRRHPHVFGDARADTAEEVEAGWQQLKQTEKGRKSAVDGIPAGLPALAHAGKVLARSGHLSVSVPMAEAAEQIVASVDDEQEFGDMLYALVAAARTRRWDAEAAARDAVRRRIAAVRAQESGATGAT